MAKPKKPTFKRQPKATGLAAVGSGNPWVDIKFECIVVGHIIPESWSHAGYKPGIMVMKTEPDDNPNCKWQWVWFKPLATEQEARDFVVNNWEKWVAKYEIRKEK